MQICNSFFARVRQSVIDQKRLRIPGELIQKYKDELSDVVKFCLPSGGEWGVNFKKNKKMAWFDDGFESFMEDNSIGINYLLLFKYTKNSRFNVHIFDLSATEIDYPCNSHGAQKRCDPVKGIPGGGGYCSTGDDGIDQSIFGSGMKRQRTTSPEGQRIYHSNESKVRKLKERSVILDGSDDANKHNIPKREKIEGNVVLQNPHFAVRLTECDVLGINMYVAADFARSLLPGKPRSIYLEDENGKRWIVKCRLRSRRVGDLTYGWRLFVQHKKLVAGNVCVFELVKDSLADKPVLKVHIFPSWEDLPQIDSHQFNS
ncbi:PREDICTED: B3 domain-containing transcription factor VRN1-like [Ipomoea nil]|uniref:B3 domain-containing transcription factor VRN1-like n=1 Tax=Ipomoea nil TaxID=35883 RepID=UPI000900C7BE|nr:PREDICTED: B3 domain-containing transcription factor VRN1-like [Ipomoea nil]